MRCECSACRASKDERPGCSRAVALRGSPSGAFAPLGSHLRVTVTTPIDLAGPRHTFARTTAGRYRVPTSTWPHRVLRLGQAPAKPYKRHREPCEDKHV